LLVQAFFEMYVTLPLHMRLLYVLQKNSKTIHLESSFHTIVTHSTMGRLLFSLVFCLIQAPASAVIFFDFFVAVGPFVSHIELIKIWRKVSFLCCSLWFIALLFSIPLMLPGRTGYYSTASPISTMWLVIFLKC
ncbi:hypothetical protein PMAYCL1PPCAC_19952, partial [Pristionchus mayeri]